MAKANAAKRHAREATTVPVREGGQDYVKWDEVRSYPSSTLHEEVQDLGTVEQTTREKSAVKHGVEGKDVPGREEENILDRAIPQLGTFAMMAAGKLQFVWRLVIQGAIWRPSDFHPLIFVHLSAFSSLTALRLLDVTFPKVREFGRLVCALPSLVCLTCENVLFTSTRPYAGLTATRCTHPVRLTDLVIFSGNETSSNVEANRSLIEHLCSAGLVAGLQRFQFSAWASSDSQYLDVYRAPIHKLLKQCRQSFRDMKLYFNLRRGKDLQPDAISDTIASVFDLTQCDRLETIALQALNFEAVGYAWMRRILESNVSKNSREVTIVIDRPQYGWNAHDNLQGIVSALKRDICHQFDELLSAKDYENLRHVDFVFWTDPYRPMPDAADWASLLKVEMPKLHERVLRTRVDVRLGLFNEDFL